MTSQCHEILFELFVLKILPFFVDILLVKVVLKRGYKRSLKLLGIKVVPRKVPKPRMVLNFMCAINA